MQKIANGYFYDVYDAGNGRVLKKKRPFTEISESVKGKTGRNFFSNWLKTRKYIRQCQYATRIFKEKLARIPQQLIGNPRFINESDYEQDNVTLLVDYWSTHSFEENKIIVDAYVELIQLFLRYGCHDYVYKFKNGYGINNNGRVVFIDFNEVTFSREKTLELIHNLTWKNAPQFIKFPEGELKEYLGKKLSETLIPETITNEWNTLSGIL